MNFPSSPSSLYGDDAMSLSSLVGDGVTDHHFLESTLQSPLYLWMWLQCPRRQTVFDERREKSAVLQTERRQPKQQVSKLIRTAKTTPSRDSCRHSSPRQRRRHIFILLWAGVPARARMSCAAAGRSIRGDPASAQGTRVRATRG